MYTATYQRLQLYSRFTNCSFNYPLLCQVICVTKTLFLHISIKVKVPTLFTRQRDLMRGVGQVKVHHRYQWHRWHICHRWPAANFATSFASVVDTGGKFATGVNDTGDKFAAGVNDTGGKLLPVSTTPAANLPPVSLTTLTKYGNNIRLQTP